MRVSPQTHASHGAALLDAAARLFRKRGMDEVRVADVAAAAGLTHGAFYGHFASKSALAESACRHAMHHAVERWRARAAAARAEGRDPLHAIIDLYLTEQHRDSPERGCWLGAVGMETARAGDGLRAALADGTAALRDVLAEELAARHQEWTASQLQDAAASVLSALVGGLVVARATAPDPGQSRAALAAAAMLARRAAGLLP